MPHYLDQKFMAYAMRLAWANVGVTAPNPTVACVIVKDEQILASGVTSKGGRPHAEVIAINKVQDKSLLKGAEIFVTLEPCSHYGKTPPCIDEIIKYQFSRVICAIQDSDPRVNGSGISKLQSAGIKVECGLMKQEAARLYRDFFKVKKTGIPFVTVKLATSLDGKIATRNLCSKWITGAKAREFGHLMRARHDAIMIGGNTARIDDPSLDCRIEGLEDFSPQKVIISSSLKLDPSLKIFSKQRPIILTSSHASNSKLSEISELKYFDSTYGALKILGESGINSILVEGGAKLITQLLKSNLVDQILWFRSNKIIGSDGVSAIGEMGFDKISEVINSFHIEESFYLGEDLLQILVKKNA